MVLGLSRWQWRSGADRFPGLAPDAEFDGNRWNDLHYTTWCKRAAQGRVRGQGDTP